jgi:hypothetical protein
VLADCRANRGLRILNRGNSQQLHAEAKARVSKARKFKLKDSETEEFVAEVFLNDLESEVAKFKEKRGEIKKEVEELKAWERVLDELIEAEGEN